MWFLPLLWVSWKDFFLSLYRQHLAHNASYFTVRKNRWGSHKETWEDVELNWSELSRSKKNFSSACPLVAALVCPLIPLALPTLRNTLCLVCSSPPFIQLPNQSSVAPYLQDQTENLVRLWKTFTNWLFPFFPSHLILYSPLCTFYLPVPCPTSLECCFLSCFLQDPSHPLQEAFSRSPVYPPSRFSFTWHTCFHLLFPMKKELAFCFSLYP